MIVENGEGKFLSVWQGFDRRTKVTNFSLTSKMKKSRSRRSDLGVCARGGCSTQCINAEVAFALEGVPVYWFVT